MAYFLKKLNHRMSLKPIEFQEGIMIDTLSRGNSEKRSPFFETRSHLRFHLCCSIVEFL